MKPPPGAQLIPLLVCCPRPQTVAAGYLFEGTFESFFASVDGYMFSWRKREGMEVLGTVSAEELRYVTSFTSFVILCCLDKARALYFHLIPCDKTSLSRSRIRIVRFACMTAVARWIALYVRPTCADAVSHHCLPPHPDPMRFVSSWNTLVAIPPTARSGFRA